MTNDKLDISPEHQPNMKKSIDEFVPQVRSSAHPLVSKELEAVAVRVSDIRFQLAAVNDRISTDPSPDKSSVNRLIDKLLLELEIASKLLHDSKRQARLWTSKAFEISDVKEVEREKFFHKRQELKSKILAQKHLINKLRQMTVNSTLADVIAIRAARDLCPKDVPIPAGLAVKSVGNIQLAYPDNPSGADFIVDHLRDSQSFPLKVNQLTALSYLKRRGGIMIDVGANIGLTSIPPVLLGLIDRVVAFEPEQVNFNCLKWSIEANGLGERIETHRAAIGATVGEATLVVTQASGLHHLLGVENNDVRSYEAIPMRSLDDVALDVERQGESVSFVKIDTQGSELSILRGATKLLKRSDILWEIEFWPEGLIAQGSDPEQVIDLLRENFAYFLDEKAADNRLHPIAELPKYAALLVGSHHTDFLLVH